MAKTDKKGFMFGILVALAAAHGLNDAMQSIISAIYPLLKSNLNLTYGEIGLIALTYQISSSIMQPLFGYVFDKKPAGWFLPVGLCCTMCGLILIAFSGGLYSVMGAVFVSGIGSSIMHPEASRITSLASGGKRGLAQSIFQVGGSTGFALGPLLAALFVREQTCVAKFAVLAVLAMVSLVPACRWYSRRIAARETSLPVSNASESGALPRRTVWFVMAILMFLVFSKNFYTVSFSNYYTFYLMSKFGVSIETSQVMLFVFLLSTALGTLVGGPVGDKYGRRLVIWWSILGSAPFALAMPYANFEWTVALSVIIGLIMSSAFSAILVYAQELLPMKVGLVSGIFFGFAFGIAGVSSAVLGKIADATDIQFVYKLCSFFPLLGIVAYFLPRVRTIQAMKKSETN
ncbi:MFS transporter [Opitutia bacterium KCR 482]|nr:MFS transporter [Opitutae bacterium KCR 482]